MISPEQPLGHVHRSCAGVHWDPTGRAERETLGGNSSAAPIPRVFAFCSALRDQWEQRQDSVRGTSAQ